MTPSTPKCRKGATFHSPPPSEQYFTPPSLPRRSQTSLEDVVDEKKRRATLALEDFDRKHGDYTSSSPAVQSYRDEGLPFPQGLIHNTLGSTSSDKMAYIKEEFPSVNERKSSLRPQRRRAPVVSDSGLGSSIKTKVGTGAAVSAITMSAAPGPFSNLQRMSQHASDVVHEEIIKKLLSERSFKDFHPIVSDCPRAIGQGEIVCIRDLEKTLTLGSPHRAKSADIYEKFCMSTIICIQTALTMGNLSDSDRTRPQDRPYTAGYFTDLVAQVQQAALQISASREKEAKGEKLTEMDAKISDEIKLYGGLAENGRPAELVRMKNGTAISVATGEPVDMEAKSHPMKRSLSEDDEDVRRSMARRKKSATAAELAPKECRQCGKTFPRPCDLTKHEKTHSRPWKCADADCRYSQEGWPTEKELIRHQNDRHSKAPKMYHCLYKPCQYKSKRDSNCKQHMEKSHGWVYERTKSNGKKRKTDGPAQRPTPRDTGLPTPVEQLHDDFENQNNGSVAYEQSVYSPGAFGNQNNGSAYQNSAYSPEDYSAPSSFSPALNDDLDLDVMPQLHVEDYSNSPNSNMRHGSTDSSVPSPYGSDTLAGFHLENGNESLVDFSPHSNYNWEFPYYAMDIPAPSVYQDELPEFTPPSCVGNQVQQISPGGHGNHVLYTPASLQAVDEGFEDYAPGGNDFPLYSSTMASNDNSRVPLFGEIPSAQDPLSYPPFLNTPEGMDYHWDTN